MIEFAGILQIHLKGASGLKNADIVGLSDPYVIIEVMGGSQQGQKIRSKTKQDTLEPVWDEHLQLCVENLRQSLSIKCFDEDDVGASCCMLREFHSID